MGVENWWKRWARSLMRGGAGYVTKKVLQTIVVPKIYIYLIYTPYYLLTLCNFMVLILIFLRGVLTLKNVMWSK